MKKISILVVLIAFVTMIFNPCPNPVITKLGIDMEKSSIFWKGYKPTGTHDGSLNFTSGTLEVNEGKVKGGEFTVDMTTIKDREGNKRLEGHLNSADFFEVEVYPSSSFVIKSVNTNDGELTITGDLTIKGITKDISFGATFDAKGDTYVLTSEKFQVNRADFNVKFNSKTFFNDLKEKFINDEFDLQVTIVAGK